MLSNTTFRKTIGLHAISIFLIIFIEGFVTVSLEILTIRQLIPFFGGNVIATSLIIGIFLLFLAIGYRAGGLCDSKYRIKLRFNLLIAAVFLGIGLSYPFISIFFHGINLYIGYHYLTNLIIYLLFITAPAVYCLGQTIPITLNFFDKKLSHSVVSSWALYLSTLGSFLGAVLTSLLLLSYLGVAWSIFINFCLLLFLITLLLESFRKNLTLLITAFTVLLFVYSFNIKFENNYFVHTNHYANYQINEVNFPKPFGKDLIINDSRSSFIDKNLKAHPYIEKIKHILFDDLQLTNKNILVIGAGGFTLSAEKTNANHFTYIDVDKDIQHIVKKHFNDNISGEFIAQDARLYLAKTDKKYHVIVNDVYTNPNNIPAYLLTEEHLSHIRRVLTEQGIAIFNIIAKPFLADNYSKSVDNTIQYVFPNCMKIPLNYSADITNIIYLCKKSRQEGNPNYYSDRLNRATLDFYQLLSG